MEVVHAWQYCIFVFIAVMGMLQLIATINQLKGMLFIRNRTISLVLSIAAIVFAFWWFFFRDNRLDTVMRRTGLEGAQQFTVFCWTTFAALVFTLVLSSLLRMFVYRRDARGEPEARIEGAYQVRYMSWFEALRPKSPRGDSDEIKNLIRETESILREAMEDAGRAHDSLRLTALRFLKEELSDLSRSVKAGTIGYAEARESILDLRERVDNLRNKPRAGSATAAPESIEDLPYLVLGVSRDADGYEILGVSRGASKEDVDRAFKQKQLGWHPDKFPSPDDKKLANAVSTILNNAKDQIYRQRGWK